MLILHSVVLVWGALYIKGAMDWMRERKASGTDLFVTADNKAAMEMYRKLGYRVIDNRMLAPLN